MLKLITILLFLTLSSFHIKASEDAFTEDPGHENKFGQFLVVHDNSRDVEVYSRIIKNPEEFCIDESDEWKLFDFTSILNSSNKIKRLNVYSLERIKELSKFLLTALEREDTLDALSMTPYVTLSRQNFNGAYGNFLLIVFKALQANGKIRKLLIRSKAQMGHKFIEEITTLSLNFKNLKYLNLTVSKSVNLPNIDPIMTYLKQENTLRKLSLSGNSLTDEWIKNFSVHFKEKKCLTSLNFQLGSISDEGAVALTKNIKTHINLASLSITHNKITDNGAIAFSDFLRVNTTLTFLNLSGNLIADNGAIALAQSLIHNTVLRTLNINFNKITEEGRVAFKEVLEKNQTIRHLFLKGH